MSEHIFTISAKDVIAANLFRNPDDEMGQVHGIHIKPDGNGGAVIAATDGHSAVLIHGPFNICLDPVTITPSKSFIAALKTVVSKPVALVRFDGERLSLLLGETVLMDQHDSCKVFGDDPYPSFDKAILAANEVVLGGYKSASLSIPNDALKPFQAVAKLYGGDTLRSLTLYPSGPATPCIVRMDCNPDFVGIVMPMYEDETGERVEEESATCRNEPLKGFDADVLSD